jgi:hypothetical protein
MAMVNEFHIFSNLVSGFSCRTLTTQCLSSKPGKGRPCEFSCRNYRAEQGCQILLCTTYQNGENRPNFHKI